MAFQRKSDGLWIAALDMGRDANGKASRRYVSGHTLEEANRKLAKLKRELAPKKETIAAKGTVGEFLQEWLIVYVQANLRPNTQTGYEQTLRKHVIPRIGKIQLGRLSPTDLAAVYASMQRNGLSPRMRQLAHAIIHRALSHAVRWKRVPTNVADMIDAPRNESSLPNVLDAAQVQRLLESSAQHRLRALWYLAIETGLRRGEVLGLRWSDVDLPGQELRVRHSLQRLHGELVLSPLKTRASTRTVALSQRAVEELCAHQERQHAEKRYAGKIYHDQGAVFAGDDGRFIHPNALGKMLNRVLTAADLPHVRFHDLRHTSATLLLLAGEDVKVAQERLGHEDATITNRTYRHVLPAVHRGAAEKMGQLLSAENTLRKR